MWTPDAVHRLVNDLVGGIILIILVLLIFGNPFIRRKDDD